MTDIEFGRADSRDRFSSPRGASFWPWQANTDSQPDLPFPLNLAIQFQNLLDEGQHRSKKLLTMRRRTEFKYWLEHPTDSSTARTQEERQREANAKHHCLKHYYLDKGQIYRKPGSNHGQPYGSRYVACTYDAANLISILHVQMHHASKSSVAPAMQDVNGVRGREGLSPVHRSLLWNQL
jgi:hypothetical protein